MSVDPEFQFLEEKIVSTTLKNIGARYHVPEVDRQIQLITERMRAHNAKKHFPRFTRHMTI